MRVDYVKRDFTVTIEEQAREIRREWPCVKHVRAENNNANLTVYSGEWSDENEDVSDEME